MSAGRQRQIETMLREQGECSVEYLAQTLGVSDMTIRRDLAVLAEAGKVIRTYGGATPGEKVLFEFKFLKRSQVNEAAKRAVAATAAKLVRDGQSIMMDSGTTTLALACQLVNRSSLTLITTSLPIAAALQHSPGVRVLLLGGFVRVDAPDISGALTESNLEQLHADLAFIGADGIDLKGNIYNASVEVGRMLAKMAAASSTTYIVADSSKIGQTALSRFGHLAECRGLITDAGLAEDQKKALKRAGLNLILAQSE